MSFAQIAAANGAPIVVEGHYANPKEGPETSTVAQVAEVEVDTETGEVTVTRDVLRERFGQQRDSVVFAAVGEGQEEAAQERISALLDERFPLAEALTAPVRTLQPQPSQK